MPRKREGSVQETVPELETLAAHYHGGSRELRIRMLLCLLNDPASTNEALAHKLDVGERTIRRWWNEYRRKGLEGLLTTADDAPSNTVTFSFKAHKQPVVGDSSTRFTRFLNHLPTTFDSTQWMRNLQAELTSVLDGVDRVSITVNLGSDVDAPDGRDMGVLINKMVYDDDRNERSKTYAGQTERSTPGEAIVEQIRRTSFPLSEYHAPHLFDYLLDDNEYVGTIILWSLRTSAPIPRSTIDFVRSLRGFFGFLLSDCIARQIKKDPTLRVFKDVVIAIAYRIGLTRREREVFSLQMVGLERDEIAERLGIKRSTVNGHIEAIHTKAKTPNYNELLTRFFTPLGDD